MKRNPSQHLRDYGAAGRESMNKTRALQAMAYRFGVILPCLRSDAYRTLGLYSSRVVKPESHSSNAACAFHNRRESITSLTRSRSGATCW
jgi:hypothetical protein